MAKLRPSTKTRITKLFKGGTELPDIKAILKEEGFTVSVTRIKTVLRKYFMKYCDNLWSHAVKLKADNLCLVENKACSLNSHHMIGRINYKYRWDLNNGLCLGIYMHTMAHDMAAHGSTSATQAFADWMEENASDRWQWFQEHRYDHELIKVDVYFLLETAKRLESEIETLKNRPKVDIMARKKSPIPAEESR